MTTSTQDHSAQAAPVTPAEVLRIEHLSKTFAGTRALTDVSLSVPAGDVHALIGSNGSGKSTLIKILAGYHRPDPGAAGFFAGEPFDLGGAAALRPDGLRFIHQDLGMVLELDAIDNFGLKCGYAKRGRLISWREQARRTRKALGRFGVDLDVRRPLSQATPVERTVLAIAAAIEDWDAEGGLLVLDEPTAALPPVEVAVLFDIIAKVVAEGASVMYVSHRLDEIFRICDSVSVLRAGKLVASRPLEGLAPADIASLMIGTEVATDVRPERHGGADAKPVLEATDVHGEFLRGVSVTVGPGEIVGVAGLLGSGREELPYVLAGARASSASGRIRVGEETEWQDIAGGRFHHPLVPADRLSEGMIGEMSVQENLALPSLAALSRHGVIAHRDERQRAYDSIDRVGLVPAEPERAMATLSGGNQQKVVVSRWLSESRPLLILAEPTAGVDIAARMSLFRVLIKEAENGLGLLVSSSDVDDLLHLCTRVLVLREGRIVRELAYDEISETSLLHAMEGIDQS